MRVLFFQVTLETVTSARTLRQTGVKVTTGWTSEEKRLFQNHLPVTRLVEESLVGVLEAVGFLRRAPMILLPVETTGARRKLDLAALKGPTFGVS